MLCRTYQKKNVYIGLIVLGIISIIAGVLIERQVGSDAGSQSMMAGMITGMGAAFAAVGIIRLIRVVRSSAERLKAVEIEANDERNIQILRASYTVVAVSSMLLLIIAALVLLWLGYMTPAWIVLSILYTEVVIFFVSYKIFSSRM